MTKRALTVAVAFPKHDEDRGRVRALAARLGVPMPALYVDGIERPCTDCGMVLDIGPRLAKVLAETDGVIICCPVCIPARLATCNHIGTINLGNPQSRPEG